MLGGERLKVRFRGPPRRAPAGSVQLPTGSARAVFGKSLGTRPERGFSRRGGCFGIGSAPVSPAARTEKVASDACENSHPDGLILPLRRTERARWEEQPQGCSRGTGPGGLCRTVLGRDGPAMRKALGAARKRDEPPELRNRRFACSAGRVAASGKRSVKDSSRESDSLEEPFTDFSTPKPRPCRCAIPCATAQSARPSQHFPCGARTFRRESQSPLLRRRSAVARPLIGFGSSFGPRRFTSAAALAVPAWCSARARASKSARPASGGGSSSAMARA